MRYAFVLLLSLFSSVSINATEKNATEKIFDKHVNRTFVVADMEGWILRINEEVLQDKSWPLAKRIMSNQLFNVKRVLKNKVVKDLQKIIIYVDIKQQGKSGAEYHPSKQWLENNKFTPAKAKCVEISHIDGFIRSTRTMPWLMLHELIHGYHDQVLDFDNKKIIDAFNKAIKAGKYKKVKHISGRTVDHYAATNHKEYLAEACEAYFGVNDYFPFTKGEILDYDPDICKILKGLEK